MHKHQMQAFSKDFQVHKHQMQAFSKDFHCEEEHGAVGPLSVTKNIYSNRNKRPKRRNRRNFNLSVSTNTGSVGETAKKTKSHSTKN